MTDDEKEAMDASFNEAMAHFKEDAMYPLGSMPNPRKFLECGFEAGLEAARRWNVTYPERTNK